MEITLENQFMKVCLSPIGAAIRSIDVTLSDRTVRRITLCFAGEETRRQNPFYSGATLAPAAGRIKDGYLPIGPESYALSKNENGITHIHGGFENLSFHQWEVSNNSPGQSATFQASLPDGREGYPGNRTFFVTYRLTDRRLSISLYAKTDRPTYINMSNHAYFNLNGFHASGLDQYLKINATQVYLNDGNHIPYGVEDIIGTEFDFTDYRLLDKQVSRFRNAGQVSLSRGYNHCFLLSGPRDQSQPSYSLMSGDRKLAMDFYTDAPGVVLYTGGFFEDHYLLSRGDGSTFPSGPGCAVALEPSFPPSFPDAHGHLEYPVTESEFHRELAFHLHPKGQP